MSAAKDGSMRRILLAVVVAASLGAAWAEAPDGFEIMRRSDATLFGDKGAWTMSLADHDGDKVKASYEFSCLAGGTDRFLMVAESPAVMRGQAILRLGDTIYQYIRKIDRLKQVAASVAFFSSTFSMEDVVATSLSAFYEYGPAESLSYAGQAAFRVTMSARSRSAAYSRIVCYVRASDYRPLAREYHAYSGTMVKRLTFEEQRSRTDGRLDYVRIRMEDALRPRYYSVVAFSGFDYAARVTDDLFTIANLRKVAR